MCEFELLNSVSVRALNKILHILCNLYNICSNLNYSIKYYIYIYIYIYI